MKKLYAGFDLCAPSTSVSMTINGPAPIILAMFMNTAIDQQVQLREQALGRTLTVEEFMDVKQVHCRLYEVQCKRYSKGRSRAEYMYFLNRVRFTYDGGYSTILYRPEST